MKIHLQPCLARIDCSDPENHTHKKKIENQKQNAGAFSAFTDLIKRALEGSATPRNLFLVRVFYVSWEGNE